MSLTGMTITAKESPARLEMDDYWWHGMSHYVTLAVTGGSTLQPGSYTLSLYHGRTKLVESTATVTGATASQLITVALDSGNANELMKHYGYPDAIPVRVYLDALRDDGLSIKVATDSHMLKTIDATATGTGGSTTSSYLTIQAPDGTLFRVYVDNDGNLQTLEAT